MYFWLGRDEKGCLPSTMKKAVVDVNHPAFFMVDVEHPAFFNLVDVNHCLFHGRWQAALFITPSLRVRV